MKKVIIICLCLLLAGGVVYFVMNSSKDATTDSESIESKIENKEIDSTSDKEETQSEEKQEGYEIITSEKEITVQKGNTATFDITFTNPDETSIREFIHSDDQDDIIEVRYTPIENKKITVEVEGLKIGKTEILISDYEYPDTKVYVKVNVVE